MKHRRDNRKLLIFAFMSLVALVESKPEWVTAKDGRKYLIEIKYEYTWFEAVHECSKRNLSLVAIETAEKNFNLVNLLKNQFGNGLDLWIGATESTAENSARKFVWASSGKAFNFANWENGEPNNLGGNQPCVHIWSKTNNFTWADGQWALKYGYICEETLLSNYQQTVTRKRQMIKDLIDILIADFKRQQHHVDRVNEALQAHIDQVKFELRVKLEKAIILIEHILEEM